MNIATTCNTIDFKAPDVNIYGCPKCPWCGGHHRAGFWKTKTLDCDDCGFSVPYDMKSEELSEKDCING